MRTALFIIAFTILEAVKGGVTYVTSPLSGIFIGILLILIISDIEEPLFKKKIKGGETK